VIRYRVLISGQVQGVYFRSTCRRMALEHGVSGWVRNLPDGRVEAVFEGPTEDIHHPLDWARRGPHLAVVADVAVQAEVSPGFPARTLANAPGVGTAATASAARCRPAPAITAVDVAATYRSS
jgi:acylphosphatase